MNAKLLAIDKVCRRTSLCKSAIYSRMKVGTFPRPKKLAGIRRVAWLESDINDWINSQID